MPRADAKGSPRAEGGKEGEKTEGKEAQQKAPAWPELGGTPTLACRGRHGALTLELKAAHLRPRFLGREARTQGASVSSSLQLLPTFSFPAAAAAAL